MAFGSFGLVLFQRARGIDRGPCCRRHARRAPRPKMLLAADTNDDEQLDGGGGGLAEQLGRHLRQRGKRRCRAIDRALQRRARYCGAAVYGRRSRRTWTTNWLSKSREAAAQLFARRVRVRYLRLTAARLEDENLQRDFFSDDDAVERSRALHRAIDRIREKYGEQAVKRGPVALAEKLREREE
jgi:hypothetical protein